MRTSDFVESAPGRLVQISSGVSAFVPNPLPPEIPAFSAELMNAHGDARYAVGKLEKALPDSFDPWLLAHPLMRREAYYSSLMEGTYTTPEQMALFDETEEGTGEAMARAQTREVMNYVYAIERGCGEIRKKERPITSHLIRMLHRTLLSQVRGNEGATGEFRKKQNYIGRQIDGIEGARFIPPPPADVDPAMLALENYIQDGMGPTASLPTFVSLAFVHYQFEAIHPFEDGNGRIGRLLIPLILIEKGVLKEPLLHISPSLEKRREEYLDRLLAVSQRGDWENWILFFLQTLQRSSEDALRTAEALVELRRKYLTMVRTPRASGLLQTLVEGLFRKPSVTFNEAADKLGVTHAQASAHVRRLEELGILKEITGGTRNLRFLATELLKTVFSRA